MRWINWNQKLKLKTKRQIFLSITFRLCYTFSPAIFPMSPYSKCTRKLSNFQLHQEKIFWFLVFSLWFWFQFIQRIDHKVKISILYLPQKIWLFRKNQSNKEIKEID